MASSHQIDRIALQQFRAESFDLSQTCLEK
jgi:hypothetical protein